MSALDAHRWKIVKAAIEDKRVAFVREAIVPLQPFSSHGYYELTPRMRDGRAGFTATDFLVSEAEGFGIEYCVHRWLILAALLWLREKKEVAADAELCFIRPASQSLMDEQFGAFVVQMLHESKVPPRCLCFEIGEKDVVEGNALVERFIDPLLDLGCRIAIDDLGARVGSFSYLHCVPAHFIKIDDRLVARTLPEENDPWLVEALGKIGCALGKDVIAKGAGSPEIVRRLREMKVDYAQGLAI